jgi:poly(3-hydroxybutyrate) depolymerase
VRGANTALAFVVAACGDNRAIPDAIDAATDSSLDAGWSCNGTTGLTTPLPALAALTIPVCKTTAGGRAAFDDGAPRQWTDSVNGDARAACVFRPSGAQLRPLVLFFHGSSGYANMAYDATSLRAKAVDFDLAGSSQRLGFVLASDQGQYLDNPNGKFIGAATRHDIYYRDLGSPSTNPDFRNVDRLVDELVAEGGIDPTRLYVMGWSNGALFGQEYAIARHNTATPGGNRIAAAAIYAGADPFQNISPVQQPSCAYVPYPTSDVPIYVMHRDCDLYSACDSAQQVAFGDPPGFDVTTWVMTLRTAIGDPNVTELRVDAHGAATTSCADTTTCTMALGASNHTQWLDGIADGSGIDWEPTMLGFLRDHPLQ